MTDFALLIAAVLLVGVALIGLGWAWLMWDDGEEDHPDTQDGPWADDHR